MAGESLTYHLIISEEAQKDIQRLKRSEPGAFKKVSIILTELILHPYMGTGHPHPLKSDRSGQWSRSISKKHRLIYQVNDDIVIVEVLAAYGHYDDK